MMCPYCGKDNAAGEQFCSECGMVMGTADATEAPAPTITCPTCKFKNPADATVCICGTELTSPEKKTEAVKAEAPAAKTPEKEAENESAIDAVNEKPTQEKPKTAPPERRAKKTTQKAYICAQCGTENSPRAKFCAECGAKRSAAPTIKQGKLMLPKNFVLVMQDDEMVIGRRDVLHAVDSNVATSVSREHCTITREGGEFYLTDNNSTNGTELDGVSIKGKGKQHLHDGSEIILAKKIKATFTI